MKKLLFIYMFLTLTYISCSGSDKAKVELTEIETTKVKIAEVTIAEKEILEFESVSVFFENEILWSIGQNVDLEIKKRENTTILTDLLGVPFGPISGIEESNYKIGWNNMDVIMYIEITDQTVKTADNLSIGSTKSDVIKTLGLPHIENNKSLRYQNSDFEIFGILFLLDDNDIVSRIILFAYV